MKTAVQTSPERFCLICRSGKGVSTESFMIQKIVSCLVKLLRDANERNTAGDLFATECFDQPLSTNSLDLVFNVILR